MTHSHVPDRAPGRGDRLEASQIKGRTVVDPEGRTVGTIQDLVVALSDGRIVDVVVWFHQRPDGEASYRLLPWAALRLAEDGTAFAADPSRAVRLEPEEAPGAAPVDDGGSPKG